VEKSLRGSAKVKHVTIAKLAARVSDGLDAYFIHGPAMVGIAILYQPSQ